MKLRDQQILHIALPSIVSNITVPLLGLVDVAIMGHLGNAAYIGAIAVGTMCFNVVYWLFGFLRMGTGGMTSQAYGARNLEEVAKLLLRSLTIGLSLSLLILLLQYPLCRAALWVIHPTAEIANLAQTYFYICIWGAPAVLGLYCLTGWYIGMQNTRIPMFVSILQNVVNIVVSLILVVFFGMKIEGAAIGTLVAQYVGLAVGLVFFVRYYLCKLRPHLHWKGVIDKMAMGRFFKVNRDIFLRTVFLVAVNLFFTSAGASQGTIILAVNTLLLQLFTLFSYVMDGFAYAGEALGGRYYGAGNDVAFRDTVKRVFVWGGVVALGFTLVYALGGKAFLSLLTDNETVIAASLPYFIWAVLIPITGMAAFIWDGLFIGITATRGMLISSAMASVVFFAVYYALTPFWANHALWLAFILYLTTRSVVQAKLFSKVIQK